MSAVQRLSAALTRRLQTAVGGIPEGQARRDAVEQWFAAAEIGTGYDVRTLKNWMQGATVCDVLKLDDLNTYFPGIGAEVFPAVEAIDPETYPAELRRAVILRHLDALAELAKSAEHGEHVRAAQPALKAVKS